MSSYSEGETVVITIAAACTIVLNEQFKTQKKKKKKKNMSNTVAFRNFSSRILHFSAFTFHSAPSPSHRAINLPVSATLLNFLGQKIFRIYTKTQKTHGVVSTSIRRLFDVGDVVQTSYRLWNDVVCLLGKYKQLNF